MACAGQARPKFSLSVKDLASGGKPARGGANSWWTKYGGTNASYNPAGPHNCTLYAAFRLAENGLTTPPGWAGDADEWAELAYRAGDKVDQVPAVGAIAQWNGGQYGHVAYVEAVTPAGIIITDDNYYTGTRAPAGGYTDEYTISSSSPAWPDNFIHLDDVAVTAQVSSANPVTTGYTWVW